jgi:hypothetical protein
MVARAEEAQTRGIELRQRRQRAALAVVTVGYAHPPTAVIRESSVCISTSLR